MSDRGFRRGGRNRVKLDTGREGGAKQQFRDECDINGIMKKYEKSGVLTHFNKHQGQYGDVTGLVDFHEASNIVLRAQDAFSSLPATVRARFNNDPGEFLDFVGDAANADELVKMGLAKAKAPEPVPEPRAAPPEVPEVPPKSKK